MFGALRENKDLRLVFGAVEDWREVSLGVSATFLAAGITAVIPYIYGRLVDIAIAPASEVRVIAALILGWLIASLVGDWLNRYGNQKSYEIAVDIEYRLLLRIYDHLLFLPLGFHKEKKMGKVMNRIDRGVEDLFRLIDDALFSFLPTVVTFCIALIILFFVEWRLSLILLVAVMIYVWITVLYTAKIVRTQRRMHRSWEKAYGDLYDSVSNIEAIKSTTNEAFERKRNARNFGAAARIYKEWRLVWQRMNIWQRFIFSTSFVAVFGAGIFMLRAGQLTAGGLIMFVGYTSLLTSPLARITDQYRMVKSGFASFRRAVGYLDIPPERDYPNARDSDDITGSVSFKNVSFGYRNEGMILKNLSFTVRQGEVVALVGESGVGKTTLIGLLGRYYLPRAGKIMIDGIDIREFALASLRRHMAIVPQEVVLFNDTIKNNIRYGRTDATDEEIISVAEAAHAREFIERFPKQYDQLVGERGVKLSTGQKQRIAIARAMLRNPRILILDEATSALDSASERLVHDELARLIKGRTTFVIAHRLSTIRMADQIIVLEKGAVAEIGTHKKLLALPGGIYRRFWEIQTARGEKEEDFRG